MHGGFAIFNKTGTLLFGPSPTNQLWAGFGGPCESRDDGDAIVLCDQLADRWFLTQFAVPDYPAGHFYQPLIHRESWRRSTSPTSSNSGIAIRIG